MVSKLSKKIKNSLYKVYNQSNKSSHMHASTNKAAKEPRNLMGSSLRKLLSNYNMRVGYPESRSLKDEM